ncbi:hypothetical protein SeMB42_g04179 [Synchytrium endobioticum]|uniref:serine C-palmitoyltransferase n=1 Tax=Synchytrium endobioticum TaxID=286115 RepID=A0A507D0M0_9FUNG|nr:hypothetical protein SeMB42_g04179 [Synchytrium endobioticum]
MGRGAKNYEAVPRYALPGNAANIHAHALPPYFYIPRPPPAPADDASSCINKYRPDTNNRHHAIVKAPLWVVLTTYLAYAILTLVGRMRDWADYYLHPEKFAKYLPKDGYAPLMDMEETLYHRRLYIRIRDCFNHLITNVPGRFLTVYDRKSPDYNHTFQYTGTTTEYLNVSSYNYLGFAQAQGPCADAVENMLSKCGLSYSSARMEAGFSSLHRETEKLVARFVGKEDAVIFSMGFATNSTTIPALASKGTLIVSDELNHASLRYGCRVSSATLVTFKHNDMKNLESTLRKNISKGQPRTGKPWTKILVIVEGLYSMEGTYCKLPEIVAMKDKYKFYLYVDEAHSIGALGPNGRGICDLMNVSPAKVDVLMGTFTKSFGAAGGYICGDKKIIDQVRLHSHSAIYAESVSPIVLQQIYSSMSIIMGDDGTDEGSHRLHRLASNSRYVMLRLRELGFTVYGDLGSPVIPLLLYHPAKMPAVSRELMARGIAAVIVGYPATPVSEGRIRLCVSAAHTHADLTSVEFRHLLSFILLILERHGTLFLILLFITYPVLHMIVKVGWSSILLISASNTFNVPPNFSIRNYRYRQQTSQNDSSSSNIKGISIGHFGYNNHGKVAKIKKQLHRRMSLLNLRIYACIPSNAQALVGNTSAIAYDATRNEPKAPSLSLLNLPLEILPHILIRIANPSNFSMTCKYIHRALDDCYVKALFVKERCGGLNLEGVTKRGGLICSSRRTVGCIYDDDDDDNGRRAHVVELLLRWGCFNHTKAGWDTLMRFFVRKGFVNGIRTVINECHLAASRNHARSTVIENKLIAFGTNCTHTSKLDLLDRAALQNQLGVVKYLVEDCDDGVVDVHANDERALYFASRAGHLEVVRYLIEKCGCDPLARRGKPLRSASRWNHGDLVSYLCTKTQDPTYIFEALKEAAMSGCSNCVSILVNEGCAQVDTALKHAAQRGQLGAVTTLCNDNYQQQVLEDAMVSAASHGHLDVVRFLSEKIGSIRCLRENLHLLNDSAHYWGIVELLNTFTLRNSGESVG